MEKFNSLYIELERCYSTVDPTTYFSLSEDQQASLCLREKEALSQHFQSDQMNFENILKHKLNDFYRKINLN